MSKLQYLRKCTLIVSGASGKGLDLSGLRIVFKVKKTDAQTPNTAEIRVYNVAKSTVARIGSEYSTVILQAGYESNFGVIFTGNIKQVRSGVEGGVNTFVDISAGDGDEAYNCAVVNTTLAAGAKQSDQINAAAGSMSSMGVGKGHIADTGGKSLPRGKVMYGQAKDYMRQSAQASGTGWSIQDGKLQFVGLADLLPGQAVLLNSKTGLIGTPEQTNEGIKTTCLLNPMLKIAGRVKINEADIAKAALPETDKDAAPNKPAAITADGVYRLLTVEHSGDTHGQDWYSNMMCLDVNALAPSKNKKKKVESEDEADEA